MPSPKPEPPGLRLIKGRGVGKDGIARDQAGRKLPETPKFKRELPVKPFDMEGDAAFAWDLICAELGRLEILKPVDALALEMACECYAVWKKAGIQRRKLGLLSKSGANGLVRAPWVTIESDKAREFRAWCQEFGITPSAENRLTGSENGGQDLGDNPFQSPGIAQ